MAFKVALIGLGMAVTPHAKSLIDLKSRLDPAAIRDAGLHLWRL